MCPTMILRSKGISCRLSLLSVHSHLNWSQKKALLFNIDLKISVYTADRFACPIYVIDVSLSKERSQTLLDDEADVEGTETAMMLLDFLLNVK